MDVSHNREKVWRTLETLLAKDKAKTTINRISELGAARNDAQAHAREPEPHDARDLFLLRRHRPDPIAHHHCLRDFAPDPP
ncbi:MAG: hypothetical protein WDO74_33320 [Pseudomonadota bacterium]